jgi:CRP/FNR family transcriptional regulator, cyclic AMP receptor protein
MAAASSIQTLIQIPICRGLTVAEAQSIFDISDETDVKKGDAVFKEGDPGDGVYVLLEGGVEILKRDKAGGMQQLAKLSDGSVLGEMSLISGDSARSASAIATNDCRLLRIPSERFSKLVAGDNVAALKIIHNIAQVMSRRLHLTGEKLVDLMDKGKRKEELADFQKLLNNWSF